MEEEKKLKVQELLDELLSQVDNDSPDYLTKKRMELAVLSASELTPLYARLDKEYSEQWMMIKESDEHCSVAECDRRTDSMDIAMQRRAVKHLLEQTTQVLHALSSRIDYLVLEYKQAHLN